MLKLILLILLAIVALVYLFRTLLLKSKAISKPVNQLANIEMPINAALYSNMLTAMDEIDCAILSNANFEHVIELLFSHLPAFVPCSLVGVSQLDKTPLDVTAMQVFTLDGKRHQFSQVFDKSLKKMLSVEPNGILLEPSETYPSLAPLYVLKAGRLLLLPVFRDAELSAVLTIGFDNNVQITEETRRIARYFADRLGVALTLVVRAKSLYYQENFDAVTLLPNRRACRDRLATEISRAHRYQLQVAVMYISLDGFKKVNDAAGYVAGDAVLKQVGQRIRTHLREPDLVSRFGDDEFIVILPDTSGTSGVSKVAQKMIEFLAQPFTYDEHPYYLNANIGISIFPEDGLVVDALIQNADTAMARVKAKGYGQFMFHEAQMNSLAINRLSLERDLRQALSKDELFLQYQPQIDLFSEKLVGVEALVRWRHPTKGVISPLEFISIAEESELIDQLGETVRKMACKQYRVWQDAGIAPNRIALNISSKEFKRENFVQDFLTLLTETGVQPTSIELEITESLLLDVQGLVNVSLQQLRKQGVLIAIDDFGTGYSSLGYLVKLPFDVLKIDRLFVAEIGKSSENYEIVSVIIDLAHQLRKTVCAEGIENEAQLAFLKERGCEVAQGYFLSKPLSVEDFDKFAFQKRQ
jgi:diguanylate cyclase (GGDEF)-like protein